jgi:hypothetical protein
MHHSPSARRRMAAGKVARACLSVMLALFFAVPTSLLSSARAQKAYASSPGDGFSDSGMTCDVGYSLNPGPTNDDYTEFPVTMPDGQTITGYCQDHGAAAPAPGTFAFDWRWNGSDAYDIWVWSQDGEAYTLSGTPQNIAGFEWTPTGDFELHKASADAGITDGNACYSLAGCQYALYNTWDDANTDTNRILTLTTDASGYASSTQSDTDIIARPDAYYLKEVVAGSGYQVSGDISEVTMTYGTLAQVYVSDQAKYDPSFIRIAKYDGSKTYTASNLPEGSATLAGAVYEVDYYAGWYGTRQEAQASDSKLRGWQVKTPESGRIDLGFAQDYLVGGDSLYTDSNGNTAFPLGTYVIYEVSAPDGYVKSDKSYVIRAYTDSDGNVTLDGDKDVKDGQTYVGAAETVQRGDFSLVKTATNDNDASSNAGTTGDDSRELVAGVQFQLINDNDNAVISPDTGEEVAKGGVVCTITTDKDGYASTKGGEDVNGWGTPDGWTGALAFGSYTVHEVIPQSVQDAWKASHGGHALIAADDFKASITSDGQDSPATYVNNHQAQTPLKIVKVDSETGEQIPLTCSFKLRDSAGELVTYTSHYPEESTQDTWTASAKGEVTLPMLLPSGTYTVEEVTAPTGYALATEGKTFTVSDTTYNGWDDPITVEFADTPIKGKVSIQKTDEDTGDYLAGATFKIVAASDIVTGDGTVRAKAGDVVQDNLSVDENGKATSKELYIGAYNVVETKAPEGYCLDDSNHAVAIASVGQDTPVVSVSLEYPNEGTVLAIDKRITGTNKALAATTFQLYDPEGVEACGFDIASIGKCAKALLDASDVEIDNWDEIVKQASSFVAGESVAFTAHYKDAEGNEKAEDLIAKLNDDYTITLYQAAAPTKAIGTIPALQQIAEGYFNQTGQTDVNGAISFKYLKPGTYSLREAASAVGYHLNDDLSTWKVVVDDNGRISVEGSDASAAASATVSVTNDENEMHTTLKTESGDKVVDADKGATLVDTIRYEGAIAGQTYTAKGTLHLKSVADDGTVTDGGAFKDAAGKEVTAETTFTAVDTSGEVEVTFTFDASGLNGDEVVAFEKMYDAEGNVQMTHEDITDTGQTVKIQPKIGTELLAKNAEASADGQATAGISLNATDAAKILGSAASKLFPDADFTAVESTAKSFFVAADALSQLKAQGSAGDASADSDDSGTDADASEDKSTTGDDKASAGAAASATDADASTDTAAGGNFSHDAQAYEGEITLVDTVGYIGLTPGVEHVMRGTLMDKTTGYALEDADGNIVTAETTFTPETANGEVEVTFTWNASDMRGKETVAYESASEVTTTETTDEATGETKAEKTETEVAIHQDINDTGQTVTFPEVPETPTEGDSYDKTGDVMRRIAPFAAGGLLIAGAAIGYGVYNRRLARREEEAGE